jgi:hypothetical protein
MRAVSRARDRVRRHFALWQDALARKSRWERLRDYAQWNGVVHSTVSPSVVESINLEELVCSACDGDVDAHNKAIGLAHVYLLSSAEIPIILGAYVADCLENPSRMPVSRGRPPRDTYERDMVTAEAVFYAKECGLRATRNRASEQPSACSLVAEELAAFGVHMTEATVEKIWRPRAVIIERNVREARRFRASLREALRPLSSDVIERFK